MDWNLCIVCQKETSEALKCPLESRDPSGKTDAYVSFLSNVQEFRDMDELPTSLCFSSDITAADFEAHSARWHRSCMLKFNNSKLERAKKRHILLATESERKPSKRQRRDISKCLFCDKGLEEGDLHLVSTFDADANIRSMITELQDGLLLSRIEGGDLIARDAKYHLKCLVNLRNRYRGHIRKSSLVTEKESEKLNESRAFVELVSYIEKAVYSGTLLFKLSEIHTLYVNRLEDLGITKAINRTRLKAQLLEHFSEAQEQFDGKNVVIVFQKGMESMLREALKKHNFSEDATILAKAATIVRNDIFNHQFLQFSGSFPPRCQEDSLPSSLKLLVSLIFNGTSLKDQDRHEPQACLTVGQLIIFSTKKRSSDSAVNARHTLKREPPLPIYIGCNIHRLVRSKTLIQQMYEMGISISYDRVMEIENWIAVSTCDRFSEDGVVSPPCLLKGVFTLSGLDNCDHNTSSTTSHGSFHGTTIGLYQCPTRDDPGENRPSIKIPPPPGSKQHSLPPSYSFVPAVALRATDVSVPKPDSHALPSGDSASEVDCSVSLDSVVPSYLDQAQARERSWVEHTLALLEKELTSTDALAWAAYHSLQQTPAEDPPAICALMPLFYDKAATPAMVKHGMDVQKQAIEFLNPGQIPVTVFDQPLFTIAKYVQWKWPVTHGESVHVVMLGGLHTEMALWSTLGDILEASGWTAALIEAEVATPGTADSFLKTSHLTRTRHAHQVTLLTLHKLQQAAFRQHTGSTPIEVWRKGMLEKSPTFMYWDLIMKYETLILIFIRAHRERNFCLYVQVLEKLTPLFFALDHVNYARWMPVHIKDMKSLPQPIKDEFEKRGHWVLSKTNNLFSSIPVDQAHEQQNAYVKGSGGCIGLTENPVAFRRWMLAGPELARLLNQFEEQCFPNHDPENPKYFQNHEQGFATQKAFQKQVNSLFNAFQRMGNPFLDDFLS